MIYNVVKKGWHFYHEVNDSFPAFLVKNYKFDEIALCLIPRNCFRPCELGRWNFNYFNYMSRDNYLIYLGYSKTLIHQFDSFTCSAGCLTKLDEDLNEII